MCADYVEQIGSESDNLSASQIFRAFYGTLTLIIIFTRVRLWTLSWAK
jgi:hypothetical protein